MRTNRNHILVVAALFGLLTSCATPPAPTPPPAYEARCGNLLPFLVVRNDGTRNTVFGQSDGSQLLFLAGLAIDADGAPNAYHPDDVSGLDALANAGRPGNWYGIATDARGNPVVQGPQDPNPGFYISTTMLVDEAIGDPTVTRRYVDSRKIPYVVLPGGRKAKKALHGLGAEPGDLAIVYNLRTRKIASAIWADEGPSRHLGEGSIKLAQALGYQDTSPRTGGTAERENVYLVFPGTGLGFPRDVQKIEQGANDLLLIWGGQERLDDCAQALKAR